MTEADDSARERAIRAELGAWLDAEWSVDRPLREWRETLVAAGWAAPAWPKAWHGRDFSHAETMVVSRLFRERGVVGAASTGPRSLAAETLLAHGSDSLKQRYLRPLLTGEHSWCQLFSEPGSGSDLAGLTTRAERDGSRYVINGQKVWNTSAHHADFGILVARTDWDLPKHQGISYFVIDMRQPGVEVRPLRQMNGHASFNEVFMTDAIVHEEDRVGAEGEGWRIAQTTLSFERSAFGRDRAADALATRTGRIYAEYAEEVRIAMEPYRWYPQRAGRPDLLLSLARANGRINDPVVRQEIARALTLAEGARLATSQAEARRRSGSSDVIPGGSIGKLAASVIARQCSVAHTLIAGSHSLLAGDDANAQGLVAEILLSVPAISIAGGTDEIQRNIISERVLGLPKEPRFDTGSFRDIPRNPGRA
jgi:alkylation response protein AidB-like acyl-CoA dehydrogenase